MAELRRNPLTRKWITYTPQNLDPETLRARLDRIRVRNHIYTDDLGICPYCPDSPEGVTEIAAMVGRDIRYTRRAAIGNGWDIRVIAAQEPIFRIEDDLRRKGQRLYDTMGSPGAHEVVIMSPRHGVAPWALDADAWTSSLIMLRERMADLDRDERLGHPYAYLGYGQNLSFTHNHSTMNLVVSPFISEKVQKELSGAHEWFKMKERCLFCDIYEEELRKREQGRPHGIIAENSDYIAFIPFFAGHPFEIWVQPVEHVSCFMDIPKVTLSGLGHLIRGVLDRLFRLLGPFPLLMALMNRPNPKWGASRGYWDMIRDDWHWRIRILPDVHLEDDHARSFFHATGTRVNPVIPELASECLRAF